MIMYMYYQERNVGYLRQTQKESTREDQSVKVDPKKVV